MLLSAAKSWALVSNGPDGQSWTWRVFLGLGVGAAVLGAAWYLRRSLRPKRAEHVKIEALFVYPIKGCKGHRVASAQLTPWGLRDDRLYVIADAKDRFVTQRELPRMALLQPDMPTATGITLRASVTGADAAALEPLFVPLITEGATGTAAAPRLVEIWSDKVPGVDQGDQAARWIQRFLGKEGLRLLRVAASAHRAVDAKYGQGETAFSDGFPVLVTSEASLQAVARRLPQAEPLPIDRFRPNVHLSGCSPFEEDEMRLLVVDGGRAQLRLVKPCARCSVPAVDQEKGVKSASGEPTKTLRRFRAGLQLKASQLHRSFFESSKHDSEVFFGQNALVEINVPGATLAVGQVAQVLA